MPLNDINDALNCVACIIIVDAHFRKPRVQSRADDTYVIVVKSFHDVMISLIVPLSTKFLPARMNTMGCRPERPEATTARCPKLPKPERARMTASRCQTRRGAGAARGTWSGVWRGVGTWCGSGQSERGARSAWHGHCKHGAWHGMCKHEHRVSIIKNSRFSCLLSTISTILYVYEQCLSHRMMRRCSKFIVTCARTK